MALESVELESTEIDRTEKNTWYGEEDGPRFTGEDRAAICAWKGNQVMKAIFKTAKKRIIGPDSVHRKALKLLLWTDKKTDRYYYFHTPVFILIPGPILYSLFSSATPEKERKALMENVAYLREEEETDLPWTRLGRMNGEDCSALELLKLRQLSSFFSGSLREVKLPWTPAKLEVLKREVLIASSPSSSWCQSLRAVAEELKWHYDQIRRRQVGGLRPQWM